MANEIKNNSNKRIYIYDNLRGLAILLVVFGHMLYINSPYLKITRNFIFLIDLPLLFFISGYFSKIQEGQRKRTIKRILLPYLIFCLIDAIINFLFYNKTPELLFIIPGFGLWFLIALFFMKITLPLIDKLRYPLLMSIILFLLLGYLDISPGILGLTRTFKYLPFFLLGFYYKRYYQEKEKQLKFLNSKGIIIIFSFIMILIGIFLAAHIDFKVFTLATPYPSYDFKSLIELMERLIITVFGMIMVLLLNKIMPNTKGILTKVGKNSMPVYILHLYFYDLVRLAYANIPSKKIIFTLSIIFTVILTYILSRDIVTQYYNKLIDYIWVNLLHQTNI